jgi:DNA gyrase subunit A
VQAAEAAGFVHLSARQAQAILDMRLGRLTGLEREKLEAEYKELWALTDYLEGLLADDVKLMAAIVDELRAVREQFADARRTRIVDAEGEILTEELIDQEDMVITRTHLGYIKRTPVREYAAQGRGGRGITGASAASEGDFVTDMFAASTHDHVLLFTDKGRAYYKKVFELPEGARTAKGRAIVNVLELQDGEQVVAMLPFDEFRADTSVFFATQSGTVKKTALAAFENVRTTGIRAITIDDGDRLVGAALTTAAHDVLLTSAKGLAVRFTQDRVRPMGRTAGGVRGINLREGDRLVGMVAFPRESGSSSTLVTVCARGYGKRTSLGDYPTKNRGGKGVISIKTTTRNGEVRGVRVVTDDDHVILISDRGKLIRIRMRDVTVQGRATQGVRLMRLDDGEHVAAIERLAEPGDESGIAEAAPLEIVDDSDTVPVDMDGEDADGDDADDDEADDGDDETDDAGDES